MRKEYTARQVMRGGEVGPEGASYEDGIFGDIVAYEWYHLGDRWYRIRFTFDRETFENTVNQEDLPWWDVEPSIVEITDEDFFPMDSRRRTA